MKWFSTNFSANFLFRWESKTNLSSEGLWQNGQNCHYIQQNIFTSSGWFLFISLRDKQTIVFGSIFLECQGPCVGHEGSAASMSGCWSRNVFRNIRSHTEDYHSRGPRDRKERKHDQGSAVSNWFSWLCVCSRAAAPIEQNSGRLFHPVCSACRETTSPLNHCLVPEFWSWHFRKKKKRKKKRQK